MSSSKNKKERRELEGEALGQRERQEAQEAKKEKTRRTLYVVVFAIFALASLALIIFNSGVFDKPTIAMTMNRHEYTAAEVEYYYNNVQWNYAIYGSYYGYDSGVADDEQWYEEPAEETTDADGNVVEATEGQTWRDFFLEQVQSELESYTIWYDQAVAAGFRMPEAGQQAIQSQLDEVKLVCRQNGITERSYLNQVYGPDMTSKRFRSMLEMSSLAYYYAQEFVSEQPVSEDEITAIYEESEATYQVYSYNTFFASGAASSTTDAEGNTVNPTDAETALALQTANAISNSLAEAVEAGTDFYTAAREFDSSEDSATDPDYYNSTDVAYASVTSVVRDWIDQGAAVGDVEVIPNSNANGYYVVEYLGSRRDDKASMDVRHILIRPETTEYYTDEDGVEQLYADYVAPLEPDEDYVEPVVTSRPTEAQWAAALEKIEGIQDEWLAAGGDENQFIERVKTYTQDVDADGNPNSDNGLYQGITSSSSYVENFQNWVTDPDRQVGDYGIVQNDGSYQGYHLIYVVAQGDPQWKLDISATIRNNKTDEWFEAQEEALEVTIHEEGLAEVGV